MRKFHPREHYSQMFDLEQVEEIPERKLGKKKVDYDKYQLAKTIIMNFMDSGHKRAKVVFKKHISEARNVKDFAHVLRYVYKNVTGSVHYPVKVYVRTDKISDPFQSIPHEVYVSARLVRIFLERTDI